jgi:hypothetical protein
VNFDPAGTYNLTSNGGRDIFIASYDRMGRLNWAKAIGGTGDDQANAVVTDYNGQLYGYNIYLTGSFQGTVNFNPGAGTTNLTALGNRDIFVASYDNNGNFKWADDMGGPGGNDQGLGISLDLSGRSYVLTTGSFTGTANFDPGSSYNGSQHLMTASGSSAGFISKLTTGGAWDTYSTPSGQTASWAEKIDGTGNNAVTAISGYNITGYFSGTANFQPYSNYPDYRTSAGGTDAFVMQLGFWGNRNFVQTMGGPGDDTGTSIAVAPNGGNSSYVPMIYVGGDFHGSVDFSGGVGTGNLTSAGGSDAFVAGYSPSTGAFAWARSAGGSGDDATNALASDLGGVTAVGQYTGTANFAAGSGTFNLSDSGKGSAFLWRLDPNGKFQYARGMGGSQTTQAIGVGIGLSDYTFVGGQFQGTADFNQGFGGSNPMTAAGSTDGFVAKFQDYFDMIPVARDNFFNVPPNTTLTVPQNSSNTSSSGFMANAYGRSGFAALQPVIVAYPQHGTLSPGFYGDFTYTPASGFSGTDSFTFKAADILLQSNLATVTLNVTPNGPSNLLQFIPDVTLYPGQTALSVYLTSTIGNNNYSAFTAQATTPVPVTLTVSSSGQLTIQPQAGYSGSFTVDVDDGGTVMRSFNVTVLANTPPTLAPVPDQSLPANPPPLTLTLLGTDPDAGSNSPSHQTLTYSASLVGSPPVTLGMTLNQLTITPSAGYAGTFTVNASVSDGIATATQTFHVTVGVPPTADSRMVVLPDSGEGSVTLSGSDAVTPPANLVFTLTSLPPQGTLSRPDGSAAQVGDTFTGSPTTLTYRLPSVVLGDFSTSFTYTATNSAGMTSSPATVTLDTPSGSAGIVRVVGTPGADTIAVTHSTDNTSLLVTLNGAVVSQTILLSSINQVRVFGLEGDDTIQVTDPTKNTSIDGGTGNNSLTLYGTSNADTFTIGTASVTYRGATITAAGPLTVNGLAGNDTFTITGTPTTFGLVGGGGTDTVTASADTGFTLANGLLTTASGASVALSGIVVAQLTGGPSHDTFDVSGWTGRGSITDTNGGTVAATKNTDFTLSPRKLTTGDGMSMALTGINTANLTGGASNHTFTLNAWTGTGTLNSGGGHDALVATNNGDFTLTSTSLATTDGMSLALSGIVNARLMASASGHTFNVSGWTGGGSLNGVASGTVVATKDANFWLTNTNLSSSDGMSLGLTGIGTANLTGGPSNHTFTVSKWTGAGSLTGGGSSNTVIAVKDANFTLTDTMLRGSDGLVLTLTGIRTAQLTAGPSNDTFDVSGWTGGGSLVGSGGSETVTAAKDANFTLSKSALQASDGLSLSLSGLGTANLTGGSGDNTFTVGGWTGGGTLTGGGGNDTVQTTKNSNITLTDTTISAADGMALTLSGVRKASLVGVWRNIAFDLSGWSGSGSLASSSGTDTVIAAKGGDATLSDTGLSDDADGMVMSLTSIKAARLTVTDANAQQINAASFSGRTTLTGGAGNDTLIGGSGGNVLIGGPGNDSLVAGAGRDLLIGGGGADTLVGGAGEDLLIGGATSYDGTYTALDAIMAEWSRTDLNYAGRVAHLRGTTSGGLNGSTDLTATAAPDDGAIDVLQHGTGLDWYWVYGRDAYTLRPGEVTN